MKRFQVLVINCPAEEIGLFRKILDDNDFKSEFVAGKKPALLKLKEDNTDLVIIHSDGYNREGFETCRSIKSNARYQRIPVIFILDNISRSILDNCLESECSDYILKSLIEKELARKAMFHLELELGRRLTSDVNHLLEEKIAERTLELEESLVKLNKANKELESLDTAKSEFLNLISHEIRTPLNGIMGSLSLIGRYHFTDEVNSYFSLLDASVKRLEKFSNNIMEASNLRLKGEKMLMLSVLNPVNLIREIIDLSLAKYADKVIETSIKTRLKNPLIKGDARYLRKCFSAVIDNAFKFSPGAGTVSVNVAAGSEGFLKIDISDEGPGFSFASLENIYDMFNNAHAHYDGNIGMGLHLARLIVEAHSGLIRAGNIEPCGARIIIELPLAQRNPDYLGRKKD